MSCGCSKSLDLVSCQLVNPEWHVNRDDPGWNVCSNGLVGSHDVSLACCVPFALIQDLPMILLSISTEATDMYDGYSLLYGVK